MGGAQRGVRVGRGQWGWCSVSRRRLGGGRRRSSSRRSSRTGVEQRQSAVGGRRRRRAGGGSAAPLEVGEDIDELPAMRALDAGIGLRRRGLRRVHYCA